MNEDSPFWTGVAIAGFCAALLIGALILLIPATLYGHAAWRIIEWTWAL